jgi:hypothetical protein
MVKGNDKFPIRRSVGCLARIIAREKCIQRYARVKTMANPCSDEHDVVGDRAERDRKDGKTRRPTAHASRNGEDTH